MQLKVLPESPAQAPLLLVRPSVNRFPTPKLNHLTHILLLGTASGSVSVAASIPGEPFSYLGGYCGKRFGFDFILNQANAGQSRKEVSQW